MNGRNGTLSPVSMDSGNDWSPVSRYQNLNGPDNPYSPTLPSTTFGVPGPGGRPPLNTPPASHHASASTTSDGVGPMSARNGNPSPPASVARSSDGTGLYASSLSEPVSGRKALMMESALAEHYNVLKAYLAPYMNVEKGDPRPNRARDKLLRLSPVQFQELSTDVYDESLRREDERLKGPQNDTPKFLPPKNTFHPKRNQARQKLSTLPLERFRQLATDVFFELERRFPQFSGREIERTASPALSTASSTRSGAGRGSRQGPGGGPGGFRGPPPGGRGGPPFRNGPPGGGGLGPPDAQQNDFGRPLPKTFQQNTIVPTKGTLVEDDDDQSIMDDEDDDQDAFGLEGAAQRGSKRTTNKSLKSLGDTRNNEAIADMQKQISQLQDTIGSLESQCKEKEEEIQRLRSSHKDMDSNIGSERNEWTELRYDLERKLSEAQNLNNDLRSELEKARADNSSVERNLRLQLDEARQEAAQASQTVQQLREQQEQQQQQYSSGADSEWRQKYYDLERELTEQQQVTDEVRREAEQSLQEMRLLSERSDQAMEKEERLAQQVTELEAELKDWKSRYARVKTQVRSMRTSSMGLSIQSPDIANYAREANFSQPDGLVKDIHMTKFQLAIDELLQIARRSDGEAVLSSMKSVVLSVRKITADVDTADARNSSGSGSMSGYQDESKHHAKLKSRVSATANNLITASKNHASAAGLSPVSLLDAAASHLSMAVVELVKVVKMRPTPPDELENDDYDNEPLPSALSTGKSYLSNGFGHMRTRSNGGSDSTTYSANGSPRRMDGWASRRSDGPVTNGQAKNSGLFEFKNYLDDQTAILVQSIQPLVHSIRSRPPTSPIPPEDEAAIINYVTQISRAVQDTTQRTSDAINNLRIDALVRHAPPVIEVLESESMKLVDAGGMGEAGWREKVPPLAFRIARAMKELVLRVERIESGELTANQNLTNDF